MIDNKSAQQQIYPPPPRNHTVRITISRESSPALHLTGKIETVTDGGGVTVEVWEDRGNVQIKAGDSLLMEYPHNDGLYEAQCKVARIEIGYDHDGQESVFLFLNSTSDLR